MEVILSLIWVSFWSSILYLIRMNSLVICSRRTLFIFHFLLLNLVEHLSFVKSYSDYKLLDFVGFSLIALILTFELFLVEKKVWDVFLSKGYLFKIFLILILFGILSYLSVILIIGLYPGS